MKRTSLILIVLTLLSLSLRADAALLAYDGFDYAAGRLKSQGLGGGFGWASSWRDSTDTWADVRVRTTGMTYGGLATSGLSVETSPNSVGGMSRTFASPLGGTAGTELWFSFIMADDDTGAGTDVTFFHPDSANEDYWSGIFEINLNGSRNTGTRLLGRRSLHSCGCSNDTGSAIPLGVGDNFVVIRLQIGATTPISFWYNPVNLANLGPPNQRIVANWPVRIKSFAWSHTYDHGEGRWNGRFDEFRAGTTLRDVVPLESYTANWSQHANVYLNTTSTGAGVNTLVRDFPVLVRIPGNIVDFTEFSFPSTGRDIRFTKADDITPLFYEIERWYDGPGTADTAEVWVRVDSVKANDDLQSVRMHWGNASAPNASDGKRVFDIRNGFAGVWHFPPADTFNDATSFGNRGQNSGSSRGTRSISGHGRRLDNLARCADNEYIDVPDAWSLDATTAVTLSGWVYMDTLIYDGNDNGSRAYFFGKLQSNGYEYACGLRQNGSSQFILHTYNGTSFQDLSAGSGTLVAKEWMFIAATHDASKVGTDTYTFSGRPSVGWTPHASADNSWTAFQNSTQPFRIGMGDCSRKFNGDLDELRMSRLARSADWLKLSFMNQRPDGDKLVLLEGGPCVNIAVTASPSDTTAEEGRTVNLRVTATGTGRTYQWYRNSVLVGSATSSIYSFTAQLVDNGAQYYCVVSGLCGSPATSQVATLTVTETCVPPGHQRYTQRLDSDGRHGVYSSGDHQRRQ